MSSNQPTPTNDLQPTPTKKTVNPVVERLLNVLLLVALGVFVLVITVKGFFVSNVLVQQTSMMPTLTDGQTIWVSKTAKVDRGDVVVFFTEDVQGKFLAGFLGDHDKYVKRVVALAGDKVWVEADSNGNYHFKVQTADTNQVLDEDYYTYKGVKVVIPATTEANLGNMASHVGQANALVVKEGEMFVLGDNRNNSTDSRTLGAIPTSRLFGVLM